MIWSLTGLYNALVANASANQKQLLAALDAIQKKDTSIMAGITDINSAETTLHADLVAENGLIKQILTAFANQTLTPAQAQALVDGMNADDADAKANAAAITAALTPPAPPVAPTA